MSNTLVKKGYDVVSEKYIKQRDQFAEKNYLEKFTKLLSSGQTILDVGCGAGLPVDKFLIDKGFTVNGIDISEKQIELARKNVPQAFYEVKDMSALKEYEYCVSGIVSFYAIFHIPREQHASLFKKFASFMPKGGFLMVTMGANGEDAGSVQEFHGEKMFYSFYPPEKNTEIIKEAGFEIILNEINVSGGEKHQIILAKI